MIEPNWLWGVVETVLVIIGCMMGVHIFITIGVVGVVFAFLYYGDMRAISLIGGTAWSRTFDYAMSMIPLFILMGSWVEVSGMGKDAYDASMKWFARLKGSLAMVTTAATALFSAISGSAVGGIVAVGTIGLGEMKRYGYSAPFRTGVVNGGVLLSSLIPPSTTAIFYALLTDESVGKLFMSGIIPGILITIMFLIIIYVWVTLRPSIAPMLPREITFTWGERFKSIGPIVPIMIIFLFMLGGIYMGWFSPTEAAGMGAFSVLVVCLILRRLTWKSFNEGLLSTAKASAMILLLISAAFIYTHTMALSKFSAEVQKIITDAGLTIIPVTYVFVVVFILAGMFFDLWAMIILFTPIFYPIITGIPGAPPMAGIWLGMMFMLLCDLAAITPPMALCLYITQMIDGCPTIDVIKGSLPFYVACFVMLVLVIHFPFLATWLPGKMIGGG